MILAFAAVYMLGITSFYYNYSKFTVIQLALLLIPSAQYSLILSLCLAIFLTLAMRMKRINECIKYYFVDNYFEQFDKNLNIDNNVDLLMQIRKLYGEICEIIDAANFCLSLEVYALRLNICISITYIYLLL